MPIIPAAIQQSYINFDFFPQQAKFRTVCPTWQPCKKRLQNSMGGAKCKYVCVGVYIRKSSKFFSARCGRGRRRRTTELLHGGGGTDKLHEQDGGRGKEKRKGTLERAREGTLFHAALPRRGGIWWNSPQAVIYLCKSKRLSTKQIWCHLNKYIASKQMKY